MSYALESLSFCLLIISHFLNLGVRIMANELIRLLILCISDYRAFQLGMEQANHLLACAQVTTKFVLWSLGCFKMICPQLKHFDIIVIVGSLKFE